jgi:beta-phosphoglucomutase
MYAVIFDFDGVLADTEHLHLRAFQHAFEPIGWTLTEADYFSRYLGFDDEGVVRAFTSDHAITIAPADAAALLAAKEECYEDFRASGQVLYPTARACVEQLAADFPLAVASGSLHAEIDQILKANHLRQCFQTIVGADDVRAGKPAPDTYLRAVAALGVSPGHALAIEDSPTGLQSARGAGLVTVGITNSYGEDALTGASYIIDSLDDVTAPQVRAWITRAPTASASGD